MLNFKKNVMSWIHYNAVESSLESNQVHEWYRMTCFTKHFCFYKRYCSCLQKPHSEPNEPHTVEFLWLGTYLINLNDFYSWAVDFHQPQPWKASLFLSSPSVRQLQSLHPTRILWNWPNFPSSLQAAIWLLCTFHFSLNNWFNPPLLVISPIKYKLVIDS